MACLLGCVVPDGVYRYGSICPYKTWTSSNQDNARYPDLVIKLGGLERNKELESQLVLILE